MTVCIKWKLVICLTLVSLIVFECCCGSHFLLVSALSVCVCVCVCVCLCVTHPHPQSKRHTCMNCIQGVATLFVWHSKYSKFTDKQRDVASPCSLFTMQIIHIRSEKTSNLVLLYHTCQKMCCPQSSTDLDPLIQRSSETLMDTF